MTTTSCAQFEILVDGKPRSYRDTKAVAIEAAEYLKNRHPHSEVAVKDLRSGEVTVDLALAQTELQAGDRVGAENYYQHAEHYFRLISSDNGAT